MADLEALKATLAEGGAVVLPTETVYGLFAKALDESAVKKVYALKGRPADKAMNLNVASYQDILDYSQDQPSYLEKLYQAFFPGPLTIILKANDKVPDWVNAGLDSVGFRLPQHPVTQELIAQFGPLVGPSANISGQASGKVFANIMADFDQKVTGLADDGAIQGLDSTILDLSGTKPKILRQGAISKEDLIEAVPELKY